MPRRTDLHRILVIGSGPIIIGQAAEFDYSGTQATKALKEEGYEVILINSNPATIMTDPEFADRTYIEPVTPEFVELILEKEKPDAILPTMGGQTALNVAMALSQSGALERHGVELIGAKAEAIALAEDRKLFAEAMKRIGLACAAGAVVESYDEPSLKLAISRAEAAATDRASIRAAATRYFALETGVERYDAIYRAIGRQAA